MSIVMKEDAGSSTFKNHERRLSVRLPVGKSISIHPYVDGIVSLTSEVCTLLDLSSDGARIETDVPHCEGDSFVLEVKTPGGSGTYSVLGIVIWGPKSGAHGQEYGIKFFGVNPVTMRDLRQDLYTVHLAQHKADREVQL